MAIDVTKGLLFIGCRNPQKLIVMSTRDGKVISDMPICPIVDAVKIGVAQAFTTTAGSQLFVAAETSPGKYEIVETVKTGEGARAMGYHGASHRFSRQLFAVPTITFKLLYCFFSIRLEIGHVNLP